MATACIDVAGIAAPAATHMKSKAHMAYSPRLVCPFTPTAIVATTTTILIILIALLFRSFISLLFGFLDLIFLSSLEMPLDMAGTELDTRQAANAARNSKALSP